ncbi:MAG: integrase [Betaproteobacteria bacterium HGW-Betaproteobacteria-1]|jgi:putative transposase|nr:MAG: integrase [Betaproteobacteria bacterium HGW-Betaproteobacteria-1]
MGIAYFQKGAVIQIEQRQHVLRREIEKDIWQTEETTSGRFHEFKMKELLGLYEKGKLVFYDDSKPRAPKSNMDGIKMTIVRPQPTERLWSSAKMRRLYVKAVQDLPSTQILIEQAIAKVWRETQQSSTPPHWITVLRWKKRYIAHGNDMHALVEQHQNKGNRHYRYPQEVLEIVTDQIDNIYMTRARHSITTTLEHAQAAVDDENKQRPDNNQLQLPSRRLVKSVIDSMSAFDRYAARHGRTAAIRKFRAKLNHTVTEKRLETAEIDHTKLDLFVLDENFLPLGRPWVTVCIDSHTRCILGIYIGFEPPSYLSVARCLRHAFMPKISLKKDYPSIRHDWEAYGVMQKLVVDNGLEFHGRSLEEACYSVGTEIVYTPRKSPWYKGKIERFMRTLNEGVSYGTPGTTFSNIFEKDDYDPAKHAVMRISTLREVIYKWVADYYHQKPHGGLDHVTPAAFWASSASATATPLPEDPAMLDVILGKPDEATLAHDGIRCNGLQYNSRDMVELRREFGDKLKVEIRIDESNLGHIHVKHPGASSFIKAPALHKDYAEGISLWQHKVFRQYATRHLGKDDPLTWARAGVEIRSIIEDERRGKRKSNSKRGRFAEATAEGRKHRTRKSDTAETAPIAQVETSLLAASTSTQRPKLTAVIEQRTK